MDKNCTLVGILDDGWSGLSEQARTKLMNADCVIGAGRTLALIAAYLPAQTEQRDMDGALMRVPEWIMSALATNKKVVVLATGDPLCHGMAEMLLGKIGRDAIEILPSPTTIQIAFARLVRAWQSAHIVSAHSKDAGEWTMGATPQHGLYKVVRAVAEHDLLALFTSPENRPARIARALILAGYGDELKISVASRLLLPDETVIADLSLADAAAREFSEPNIVVIERIKQNDDRALFGFEDSSFVQRQPEKGLITKLEVRAVSLAKLTLRSHSVVWDIGAGSGSVGLEAARIARHGHVYAIEKNEADAANARENARLLRATNYTLVEGRAPQHLDIWPDPDAVFIGGSGGELAELIRLVFKRIHEGGKLVMNFVTIENLAAATAVLKELNADWEVVQLQASRSQPILDMHRLAAQNPVWIVIATASTGSARTVVLA